MPRRGCRVRPEQPLEENDFSDGHVRSSPRRRAAARWDSPSMRAFPGDVPRAGMVGKARTDGSHCAARAAEFDHGSARRRYDGARGQADAPGPLRTPQGPVLTPVGPPGVCHTAACQTPWLALLAEAVAYCLGGETRPLVWVHPHGH